MTMKLLLMAAGLAMLVACAGPPPPDSAGSAAGGVGGAGAGANGAAAGSVVGNAIGANGAAAAGQAAPGTQADLKQNVGDRVFFDTDQSTINAEGRKTLQRQAEWLKRYRNLTVTIEGHCDERGTREYNLALGERRAEAAKQLLVAFGVDPGRITTTSYGKERPAVVGSNEAAWAQNRRAVTVVD
ncbi:MAG TPA: peptidoglycan-associated lipoprotein Pal [Stellaceae bacterium]|nr:peptidoglycan-associated lipoprotein Pal [Stellaceae bacterium]